MSASKTFLEENLYTEGLKYFGIKNKKYAKQVADTWHDHENYIWRWKEAESFGDHKGKILDMASGVGTFVLHGLEKGYDVYGVEPEEWKLEYISKKIDEQKLPTEWKQRFIKSFGEKLPFKDASFDYVITYQTLEHVKDVYKCIDEMLRVLKPGGKLKIHAPSYDCFYEPHYLLPFLPKMNKKLAALYLRILNRPIAGLATLTWITNKDIKSHLSKKEKIEIADLYNIYKNRKTTYIANKYKLPPLLQR